MDNRVPMRRRPTLIQDDLAAIMESLPHGRRYTLDIAEEALARIGREGVSYAMVDLCKNIAQQNRQELQAQVRAYIAAPENRDWIKATVLGAILSEVHTFMSYLYDNEQTATTGEGT